MRIWFSFVCRMVKIKRNDFTFRVNNIRVKSTLNDKVTVCNLISKISTLNNEMRTSNILY